MVVDYGQRMRSSIEDAQKVIQHSSQALLLGNQLVADNIYFTLVRGGGGSGGVGRGEGEAVEGWGVRGRQWRGEGGGAVEG